MTLQLGETAPDFTAETTDGPISLYDYLGDGWGLLFSHPADYTPVCTTELGDFARRKPDFDARDTKLIGVSVDSVASHRGWSKDIAETQGTALNYPLLGDEDRAVANLYGMIHPKAIETATVRTVFVIGPDKKVKLTLTYPAAIGRNVSEIVRVLDALQRSPRRVHAGELDRRRRRHRPTRALRRRREGEVPEGLHGAQALSAAHAPAGQVARPLATIGRDLANPWTSAPSRRRVARADAIVRALSPAPRRLLGRDDAMAVSGSAGRPQVTEPLTATHSYAALVARGRRHRRLRSYDDALADFTAAHVARRDAARPLFERGAISMLLGRYDDALADYRAAATRDPAYPGAASYFAELYLYTGRAGAALALSRRGRRDEPTNLVHRVNIAHAYLLLGDAERATRAYDAIADARDPGKGITGAAIALDDLALMRDAGIEAPGSSDIERRLRTRATSARTSKGR